MDFVNKMTKWAKSFHGEYFLFEWNYDAEKISAQLDEYLSSKAWFDENNKKFVFKVDKSFLLTESFKDKYNNILKILQAKNISTSDVEFAVFAQEKEFDKEEWNQFKKIEEDLKKDGVGFGVTDLDKTFSIKEVENANSKIKETAEKIKENDFSPLEKLLMGYLTVTARTYIEEDDNAADSRSIFGLLNSKNIVCVGYANWLKAIMKEVGDENIKIYKNEVSCSQGKSGYSNHQNLIVHIKDEKYDIDGYYYLDPTFDSGHNYVMPPRLSFFMTPLKDIDKIEVTVRNEEGVVTKSHIHGKHTFSPWSDCCCFSSDGFEKTKEFAADCEKIYPEFEDNDFARLEKEVNRLDEKTEKLNKRTANFKKVKDILLKSKTQYPSDKFNKVKLHFAVNSAMDGDFTALDEYLKSDIVEPQNVENEQDLVELFYMEELEELNNWLVSDINDFLKKKENELKDKKAKIKRRKTRLAAEIMSSSLQAPTLDHEEKLKDVNGWLKTKSEPIGLNKIENALREVVNGNLYKDRYFGVEKIYGNTDNFISCVINTTCADVKENYAEGAVNAFAKLNKEKEDHQK